MQEKEGCGHWARVDDALTASTCLSPISPLATGQDGARRCTQLCFVLPVVPHPVPRPSPFVVALAQAPPPLISFPSFAGHPSLARVARAQGTASYQH